jgi:hypothetical protein
MGAAGALRIAFANPKLFTAVMAWDGGVTTSEIASLAEANVADIKGRFEVRLYSRPPSGTAVVPETLKRLGVDYDHIVVNTDHVGVLGERGPSNRRVCFDPSRLTAGWKFFSEVLAAPSSPVALDEGRAGASIDFRTAQWTDFRFYTPAGRYLGEISARDQLPGRGLYLVQSKIHPGRKKLMFFD